MTERLFAVKIVKSINTQLPAGRYMYWCNQDWGPSPRPCAALRPGLMVESEARKLLLECDVLDAKFALVEWVEKGGKP